MNSETVTVIIKGVKHYFNGDELTSAEQEAIIFLQKQDEDKREF
tara:strand:- start:1078 stop:1209 length:132 start_codon:yes stop_codon:yes gene_type:complete